MTKTEFMEKLSAALKARHSVETADGLLADFREHFDEALRAGQSEEEICGMLGDPVEIAEECGAEMPDGSENDASQDGAGIYINLFDRGLCCEPWDGDGFHVEVRQNGRVIQDDAVHIIRSEDSFRIEQEREWNFIRHLFHPFKFTKIVCVKVPRRVSGNISVKLSSGAALIGGVSVDGDIRCSLSSGSIKMNNVFAGGSLDLSAHSGSIKTEGCSGKLSAECLSGSIRINGHKGDIVRAAATSGSVKIGGGHINITENCCLETKSGSIHIDIDELRADLKLECYSGSVKFSVGELKGNIIGKTRSGSIVGYLNRDTRAVFILQSSDVSNRFPNAAMPDSSLPVVNLSSRSGRVALKEL